MRGSDDMLLFLVCLKMLLSLTTFQAFDTTISKVAGDRYRILLNTKQRLWRFLSCHFVSPMLKHVVSHHLSYFYFLSILHPGVLLANVSSFFSALSSLACCCCLPDSLNLPDYLHAFLFVLESRHQRLEDDIKQ